MGRYLEIVKQIGEGIASQSSAASPDIPDTLPSVSGLSGSDPGVLAKNSPPRPGASLDRSPLPPLHPGWLVVYRDRAGRLRGGDDERDCGTVARLEWVAGSFTVWLTNGESLPLSGVRAVSQINAKGQVGGGVGRSGVRRGRPGEIRVPMTTRTIPVNLLLDYLQASNPVRSVERRSNEQHRDNR